MSNPQTGSLQPSGSTDELASIPSELASIPSELEPIASEQHSSQSLTPDRPKLTAILTNGTDVRQQQQFTAAEFIAAEAQTRLEQSDDESNAWDGENQYCWLIFNLQEIPSSRIGIGYFVNYKGAIVGNIYPIGDGSGKYIRWSYSPHNPNQELSQHVFPHVAEAVEDCLLYPNNGAGTVLEEVAGYLLPYIRPTAKQVERMPSRLRMAADYSRPPIKQSDEELGRLVHHILISFVDRTRLLEVAGIFPDNWEDMSDKEQALFQLIGSILYESGRKLAVDLLLGQLNQQIAEIEGKKLDR